MLKVKPFTINRLSMSQKTEQSKTTIKTCKNAMRKTLVNVPYLAVEISARKYNRLNIYKVNHL